MTIKAINLKSLRNEELQNFYNDVLERCRRFNTTALNIDPALQDFESNVLALQKSLNLEQGSELTEDLEILDGTRGNYLSGIKTACEGLTNHFSKDMASAAILIYESINRHGPNLSRLGYKSETAVIDAITQEWSDGENFITALEKLGFTLWADELKKLNNKFSKFYQDRIDDKVEAGESFSDLRPEARASYDKVCNKIFAHSVLNEDNEEYTNLMEGINLIIDDYNKIILRRKSSQDDSENPIE